MPKTLVSPSKSFPGSITLPDALTWPQLLAFGDAVAENQLSTARPSISHLRICENSIAAVNAIVEWHIEKLPAKPRPADIFVGKPTKQAAPFWDWVYRNVETLWFQEDTVPNESPSEPTDTPVTPTEPAEISEDPQTQTIPTAS